MSLRAVWRCDATSHSFDEWSPARRKAGLGIEGTHLTNGLTLDGEPDLFLALVFAPYVLTSWTPPGRKAAGIAGFHILQLVPYDVATLAGDLLASAAVAADRLADEAGRKKSADRPTSPGLRPSTSAASSP